MIMPRVIYSLELIFAPNTHCMNTLRCDGEFIFNAFLVSLGRLKVKSVIMEESWKMNFLKV